jgi:hypothetical protein
LTKLGYNTGSLDITLNYVIDEWKQAMCKCSLTWKTKQQTTTNSLWIPTEWFNELKPSMDTITTEYECAFLRNTLIGKMKIKELEQSCCTMKALKESVTLLQNNNFESERMLPHTLVPGVIDRIVTRHQSLYLCCLKWTNNNGVIRDFTAWVPLEMLAIKPNDMTKLEDFHSAEVHEHTTTVFEDQQLPKTQTRPPFTLEQECPYLKGMSFGRMKFKDFKGGCCSMTDLQQSIRLL